MNDLLQLATAELFRFLNGKLPELSPDWWQKHVVDRLSFQQQRAVHERGLKTLQQLDFASLLRALDQNWYGLSNTLNLPREGRSWVKELQTVRNKWAHLSVEAMPASEVYRDADTLGRLLAMLGAEQASLDAVESTKDGAIARMAKRGEGSSELPSLSSNQTSADGASANSRVPSTNPGMFTLENSKHFWEQVERRGDNECWPWKGSTPQRGYRDRRYGIFRVPGCGYVMNQRFAYIDYYKLPENEHGIKVEPMARCDLGELCCNPLHIQPKARGRR